MSCNSQSRNPQKRRNKIPTFKRLMPVLLTVLLAVNAFTMPCLAQDGVVGAWPLNEGAGGVVKDRVGGPSGAFLGPDGGGFKWNGKDLVFDGKSVVKIVGGGGLLRGPFFTVDLEVKPADAKAGLYLVGCKAASVVEGGFLVHYWAAHRKLSFSMADGRKNHGFDVILKQPLPVGKWSRLGFQYDGIDLTVMVNQTPVKRIRKPGLILAPCRKPLFVGGYYQPQRGQNFRGSIRNLQLRVSSPADDQPMVRSVSKGVAPVIDGRLDDPVWRKAKFMGGFVSFMQGAKANPDTEWAIMSDGKQIYIGVRCLDSNAARIAAKPRERDGMVFVDDSIELFIDPDASGDHYMQFALSAANVQFDSVITNFGLRPRQDFNAKWNSATHIDEKGWTAEIAIPYTELMVKPGNPNYWQFNICRNSTTAQKKLEQTRWSTWGYLMPGMKVAGFHDVRLRGFLAGLPAPSYTPKEKAGVLHRRNKWDLNEKPSGATICMLPVHKAIFVANNMVVPNLFISRAPGKDIVKAKTVCFLDLPAGITLLHVGGNDIATRYAANPGLYEYSKAEIVKHDGVAYQRYRIEPKALHHGTKRLGPFYMKSSLADNQERAVYFKATWDGGEQKLQKARLITRTFPTPGQPKKIMASIGWMSPWIFFTWPEMLDSYEKLGFNTLAVQPPHKNSLKEEDVFAFADKARARGMKILFVESPFYSVRSNVKGNSTRKDGTPYPSIKDGCPSYRGELYKYSIDRIERYSRRLRPEIACFDIELYAAGSFRGKSGQCKRCADYVKQSGKDGADAMLDLGTEIMGDIKAALARGVKGTGAAVPLSGNYHTLPGGHIYQDTFKFDKMSAAGVVDYCEPVYYRSGRAKNTGQEIRSLRKHLKESNMIPWFTAGYVVSNGNIEYPTEWVYDYTLEGYASGIRGQFWFFFAGFEGSDFFYYAKAMEAVNQVAEMVYDAKPLDGIECDKAGVSVTGLINKNQILLLVSDYGKTPYVGPVTVTLPIKAKGQVWDLARKQVAGSVNGQKIVLKFAPGVKGAHTAIYRVGPDVK
jgi:Carbohydrate family 9 binding domain-like/Laminin G domain